MGDFLTRVKTFLAGTWQGMSKNKRHLFIGFVVGVAVCLLLRWLL